MLSSWEESVSPPRSRVSSALLSSWEFSGNSSSLLSVQRSKSNKFSLSLFLSCSSLLFIKSETVFESFKFNSILSNWLDESVFSSFLVLFSGVSSKSSSKIIKSSSSVVCAVVVIKKYF